jgi:hypothetical protein
MKTTLLAAAGALLLAMPAFAQPVAPPDAGPAASAEAAQADAAAAHHERKVARRAARHGHYHKAAVASQKADAAQGAADANAANAGMAPPHQ